MRAEGADERALNVDVPERLLPKSPPHPLKYSPQDDTSTLPDPPPEHHPKQDVGPDYRGGGRKVERYIKRQRASGDDRRSSALLAQWLAHRTSILPIHSSIHLDFVREGGYPEVAGSSPA